MLASSTAQALKHAATRQHVRLLHATPGRFAVTKFTMPAMSPTMTEGGITAWKKKEGDSFSAGDVLLEIETDKATIDVEAQDDGVLGKIIAKDGEKNIQVGRLIALLVEQGDDISNLQVPSDADAPPPPETPKSEPPKSEAPKPVKKSESGPSHPIHVSGQVFPSVIRLLNEYNVKDHEKIKGTGVRGMLTKGDVLAFVGKASSPTGTYKPSVSTPAPAPAVEPKKVEKPIDGPELRRIIVAGLSEITAKPAVPRGPVSSFESIVNDYLPRTKTVPSTIPLSSKSSTATSGYLDGLI